MVDPGTNAIELEPEILGDTEYQRIQITFGEAVGDAPDDRYILYINPESKQLDLINYSVTFYDSTRAENYNALKYEEWQDVQGMKVPLRMIGYRWENDILGEKRYDVQIEKPVFSTESFDDDLFKIPENAFVDR